MKRRSAQLALVDLGAPAPSTCRLCGAGCWNNAIGLTEPPCEHDVDQRHTERIPRLVNHAT